MCLDSKQLDSVEGSTNLNNLRQALAGTFKTAANSKTAPTPNAAVVPNATPTTNQTKDNKVSKFNNQTIGKDSTNVTKNENMMTITAEDGRRLSAELLGADPTLLETDQRDVKSVVDNLVSSLSKDEGLTMHQLKSAMHEGVLNMFQDDPCCSDQSDDDESDYEDIDDVCDTCLGKVFFFLLFWRKGKVNAV